MPSMKRSELSCGGVEGSQGSYPRRVDTLIIGGGQAGLATAYYLLRAGIDTLVLDDQSAPGGAWRHVWPSLRLFSPAEFSNLPGWPMPSYPDYPPAAHVVEYLAAYEKRYHIPVLCPVSVSLVEYRDNGFLVHAGSRSWWAQYVVAATGTFAAPFVPYYPGVFRGTQWHSATYPGVAPFAGTRVAVVGGANSAAQIAAELSERAHVSWYTQSPPRWMPDEVDGRVLFRRNRDRALAIARGEEDPGADSSLGDIVALPVVRSARDTGALRPQSMFSSLSDVSADHLIWCTGFRPALRPIRHLLKDGTPRFSGLHLVGYGDWVGPGAATLAGVGLYAKRAAQAIVEAKNRS